MRDGDILKVFADQNVGLSVVGGADVTASNDAVGRQVLDSAPQGRRRKLLILCNDGTENVYVNLGTSATVGEGLFMMPGEKFIMQQGFVHQGAVAAVSATTTAGHLSWLLTV